jgi:hypothetical protein
VPTIAVRASADAPLLTGPSERRRPAGDGLWAPRVGVRELERACSWIPGSERPGTTWVAWADRREGSEAVDRRAERSGHGQPGGVVRESIPREGGCSADLYGEAARAEKPEIRASSGLLGQTRAGDETRAHDPRLGEPSDSQHSPIVLFSRRRHEPRASLTDRFPRICHGPTEDALAPSARPPRGGLPSGQPRDDRAGPGRLGLGIPRES